VIAIFLQINYYYNALVIGVLCNNSSATIWRSEVLVDGNKVPGENYPPTEGIVEYIMPHVQI